VAKEQLANILSVNIEPSGLFVDSEQFYLAASPDGLIGDDGLVEIKCPSSAKNVSPEEAINNKIIKWCVLKNNELQMTIIIIKFKEHYIFHEEIIVIFVFGLQKVNNISSLYNYKHLLFIKLIIIFLNNRYFIRKNIER